MSSAIFAPAAMLEATPADSADFVLEGVFVHPDHLAGFADEMSSSWSSSDCSSIISYGTDDDDIAATDDYESSLYRDDRSAVQDRTDDYFAPRPKSASSSFYTDSTDSSFSSFGSSEADDDDESAATTPTPGSCYKAPSFSRRPSCGDVYPDLTSPSFPASFAFNTFAPTSSRSSSRPSSRPSSPIRAHPYLSNRSSAMARSVSSPVETQRQVEQRKSALTAFTASMDERARMIRSKSTPNAVPTPGGIAMSRSAAASRAASPSRAPFLTPFEEGWGAKLPPREAQSAATLPFPYNLANPPARFRLNRANSYAGTENHFHGAPVEHRNSVPTIAVSSPMSTSTSSSMPMNPSSRRARLSPLTPIVAQSTEPQHGVCAALESFTFSPSPSSPPQMVRARLNRGLSF
ncbi:hypothetical protein JCM10212_004652 [Sporobolomyces blumeae]